MDNLEENIINKLLKELYLYDQITYDHSINVEKYIKLYCDFYSIPSDISRNLRIGALVHDIGKIFINPKILNKSGKLTENEFKEISKHTFLGYKYLKRCNIPKDIYIYALYHHYRVDNNNDRYNFDEYIDKEDLLKGMNKEKYYNGIALMNICDSFEAMNSDRGYNKPKSIYESLEELHKYKNIQFDASIVTNYIFMIGKMVLQNNIQHEFLA